jgi:phosphodiesterase/alkaline phosphatase D-like protein
LAAAQPPYVVVPFEDKGLKPHTTYYYRVRAVDRDGHKGAPSEVCLGVTREPLDRSEGRMK